MPRLIDAEKLAEYKASGISELTEWQQGWNDALDTVINEVPTVDAVEVVRCKDCWVFHQDETWNPKEGLCGWFDMPVGINDFCSMGDRKEDTEPNGYWYKQGDEYRCSRCGDTSIVGFKICPNCGAIMDEVKNDEF